MSAGPSTSAAIATPASVLQLGKEALDLLDGLSNKRKTPTADALVVTLRNQLAALQTSSEHISDIDEALQTALNEAATVLQEIHSTVQTKPTIRKRDRLKRKLFGPDEGTKEPDSFVLLWVRVDEVFKGLELKLVASNRTPANPVVLPKASQQAQQSGSASSPAQETEEAGESKPQKRQPHGRHHTALDTIEKGLQATVALAEAIPPPGGGIVKAISGVLLSTIIILKGVESNDEGVVDLAQHLAELFRTILQFLNDDGKPIGDEALAQLKSFQVELQSIEAELKILSAQGKIKKAVSHLRNKETLATCDARIRRAFSQLQTHLSLDAARSLTGLENADVRRETDRLINLLGELDTGARDKADEITDLVCLPGTRVELLEDVRKWIAHPASERLLWINGVAGCGKSAVAATVASQTESLSASAIFHFSRGNQGRNDRFICCLARQLARWNHGSLEHLILAAVKENPDIASSYFAAQFQHLIIEPLKKIVPGAPPVLIVIDALDEWDKRDSAAKLVDLIRRWNAELPQSIKFVLTSRNESYLSKAFDSPLVKPFLKCCALDNTPRDVVDHDIKAYLEKGFADIRSSSAELADSDWPGSDGIKELVELSGGLFQWASTAIRYTHARRPHARLSYIRSNPNQLGDLDKLYQHILQSLFLEEALPTTLGLLQDVLGFIVVAPIPITLNTITYLLTDDIASSPEILEEVREDILAMLGAFLIIPADPDQPIRFLHPSIIDYLTNPLRCTDNRFYINRIPHNQRTTVACFRRMRRDLKRDICQINDPTKFNSDVHDLVSLHISEQLHYTSCYWAHHLSASGTVPSPELAGLVDHFCAKLVLFWLEVMGLTGQVQQAVTVIRVAEQWATTIPADLITQDGRQLLHETRRFLLAYSEPISTNIHHIYLSALPLTPSQTLFSRTYQEFAADGLRVVRGPVDKQWPACLWVADRHSDAVNCLAISPNGRLIASGSSDMTVRIWDVETGMQWGDTLAGHSAWVHCLAFSPDGQMIVSGSEDKTVRLWDVETGLQKAQPLAGHRDTVTCLAISPSGKVAVSGSHDSTLRLWDIMIGRPKGNVLEGHSDSVTCVAFSSDGAMVVSASYDTSVRFWDVETGIQRGGAVTGHSSPVRCLVISPDGKAAASGSNDNTVRLWSVETGEQRGEALVGHSDDVNCVAFSPDGKMVVSGSKDATMRLWDFQTTAQIGDALKGHSGPVTCLEFSPDGEAIASGSNDRSIQLWSVRTRMRSGGALVGHSMPLICMSFSQNSKMLVSGAADATVRLWEVVAGMQREEDHVGHSRHVVCLAFSCDGTMVASGSADTTARLWDAETGVQKGETLVGHSSSACCLVFSPNGQKIASGSLDNTIRVWDVQSGTQIGATLEGHTGPVNCLVMSPDSKTVISGSDDNTIRLWNVETGAERGEALVGHFNNVWCLAISPDGKTIASGSVDATVHLWDFGMGSQWGQAMVIHTDIVNCLAFSPDSNTVASGSHDGTVQVWDVKTRGRRGEALYIGHGVDFVEFSSDGRHIAAIAEELDYTQAVPDLRQQDVMEVQIYELEREYEALAALDIKPPLIPINGNLSGALFALEKEQARIREVANQTAALQARIAALKLVETSLSVGDEGTADPSPSEDVPTDAHASPCPTDIPTSSRSVAGPPIRPVSLAVWISRDGWVRHRGQRWFWLPAIFGREGRGHLRGNRLACYNERHVCIIDVSNILYILK